MITLITGGVKSGKSRRALELAGGWGKGGPVSFIATACALDDEMRGRIARHREERAAMSVPFAAIEEPLAIDQAIAEAYPFVLVDCLPMWINNLLYFKREDDFERILDGFILGAQKKTGCVIVSNETGWGNIPFDEATRGYNLMLAGANRRIAAVAENVELMVCGIPWAVKKSEP